MMTRLKRMTGFVAAMLCVAALLMPMTAFAMSDNTPPTISAKITGDLLHAEASDADSGVEAVFINGTRYNYLVDSALEVPLKDCAGVNEYVSVHAVDFAGNKSKVVELKNPYYQAPATTPTQTPTTPAPTPSQPPATSAPAPTSTSQPTQRPPASSTPTPSASSTPEPTPEPTESALPVDPQPFTPDGDASVTDYIGESGGKRFYVVTTPAGNVFYLIIDLDRENDNVYFLDAVQEKDLLALAEADGGSTSGESAIPDPNPTPSQPTPTPDPEPTPATPEKDSGGGMGTIFLILLAVAAVGGAGWYFKIYKPKQEAAAPDDMDDEDEDDVEGEDDGVHFENPPQESEEEASDDSSGEDNTEEDDYEDEE